MSGGVAGAEDMRDYLAGVPRPAALMAYVNIDAPVLWLAYPDQPSLHNALDEFAAFAGTQMPRTLETPLADETAEQRGRHVADLVCDLLEVSLTQAAQGPRSAAAELDRRCQRSANRGRPGSARPHSVARAHARRQTTPVKRPRPDLNRRPPP
jgi:hypothetical protein